MITLRKKKTGKPTDRQISRRTYINVVSKTTVVNFIEAKPKMFRHSETHR